MLVLPFLPFYSAKKDVTQNIKGLNVSMFGL